MENVDKPLVRHYTYNDDESYFNCDKDLKEFPNEIFENKNLKSIKLWTNKITEIPEKISRLNKLEEIYLTGNLLSSLPKSFSKLQSLKRLYLGYNKFIEMPRELCSLENLRELYLYHNKIKIIPGEVEKLKSLKILDLEHNEISEIPTEAQSLNLASINLMNNYLEDVPIEISSYGPSGILNYYCSLREKVKLYEAKLLIVGNGGVGKTCLKNRIIDQSWEFINEQNSTEGIDINIWNIQTKDIDRFRINLWDFGGQEIYHSTHQFFLTKRSLYLFVWEARKEDNLLSFDYWLNVIKLLSNNSPVIIVQNKIDERTKMIDELTISEKFPNVIDFCKVSSKTGDGMDILRSAIIKEIVNLEHIGDILPQKWITIRNHLENLGKNFITDEEYTEICTTNSLTIRQASYLSQYYHDLGVFLHFTDNILLNEIVFLKPDWATNAVYKVIDTKSVISNYGKFCFDDLNSIWPNYPKKMYKVLIELMKKFELCFELNQNNGYIIPELLLSRRPTFNWNNENNTIFEYQYDFMPVGIITRFIVRTNDIIDGELFWKDGVILKRGKTRALVISEQINRKITICLEGRNQMELLSIIRREIEYIHGTLNHLSVKEMIPCNCKICRKNKEKNFYAYDELMIYRENNQKNIFCVKGKTNVKVEKLITGFEVIEEENEERKSINIKDLKIVGGTTYISDTIRIDIDED